MASRVHQLDDGMPVGSWAQEHLLALYQTRIPSNQLAAKLYKYCTVVV